MPPVVPPPPTPSSLTEYILSELKADLQILTSKADAIQTCVVNHREEAQNRHNALRTEVQKLETRFDLRVSSLEGKVKLLWTACGALLMLVCGAGVKALGLV